MKQPKKKEPRKEQKNEWTFEKLILYLFQFLV